MARRVGSFLFWVFVALSSAALFPVALAIWAVTRPFDPRRRALHRFTCAWASLYTWLNPIWPLTIVGRERIPAGRPCVLVANHLSLLDILVLFRTFADFKWVSKIEVFRLPFIGWNMSLNGYVKLRRGDRESVARMMRHCERALSDGDSIMIFPEGTRSPTGKLREFKTGAFELALRARVPVVPILIQGTADALPKRGFVLRGRHPIRVTVLDPLPPEGFAQLTAQSLAERVRETMRRALGEAD